MNSLVISQKSPETTQILGSIDFRQTFIRNIEVVYYQIIAYYNFICSADLH